MDVVAKNFQSPRAQFIMKTDSRSMEILEMAQAEERAHLPHTRGRILGHLEWMNSDGKFNGAQLAGWDSERRVVTLRLADTRIPSFQATVDIPLDQLEAWIGERESEQMQD